MLSLRSNRVSPSLLFLFCLNPFISIQTVETAYQILLDNNQGLIGLVFGFTKLRHEFQECLSPYLLCI